MHLCFITTFTPLRKEQKRNKETKPIFEGSYLRNARCDLVVIEMLGGDISTAKIVLFR